MRCGCWRIAHGRRPPPSLLSYKERGSQGILAARRYSGWFMVPRPRAGEGVRGRGHAAPRTTNEQYVIRCGGHAPTQCAEGEGGCMAANLLERDSFLSALDGLLCQVAEGTGQIALVSGEAGIGKTSLVERFLACHQET